MRSILILLYLFIVLGVIFIERKNPTEAILWVVVLLCLPYVGLLLYLAFGSTLGIKLTAKFRTKRLNSRLKEQLTTSTEPMLPLSSEDYAVMNFNRIYNHSVLTYYDDAKIYISGKSHYARLFEDIEAAKESIHVEFYTIHKDMVGEHFVRLLAKKAKEGVQVIVMCDYIANLGTPKSMFQELVDAGGQVKRLKPYLTHFRSHRKIVVIDSSISYIGGMNIGKQYAGYHKKKTPWRDTQIRLTGPCAKVLESCFLSDWFCAVKKKDLPDAEILAEQVFHKTYTKGTYPCQFVMGGVDTEKESVKMCYMSMIRSAKKTIRIQSPYFIPDESVLDALRTAAASGIQIELMVPGVKASFFLDPVTTHYCGELLKYGAKVYKYDGYIHAKTMVIDKELCCIGSVNMDMRSLMIDDEICGVFYDNALVWKYNEIYQKDISHCEQYTLSEFKNRGRFEKMKESFFLLFAPLM